MARSTQTPPPPPPAPPDDNPRPEAQEPGEKYLTLWEHLSELRYRVTMSAIGVVLGLAVSAFFAADFIDWLKEPAEEKHPGLQLQFIEPFENFVTYFRVSLLGGLVVGMPMIIFQALRFLSPGLKPGERIWLYGTVVGATGLFLGGVAFAYYIALPPALDFLLNFNNDLAEPNIRIGSYVDFVTRLLFWTGVSFQTPLIVMYLARFRIVRAGQLIRWWRLAIVAAFVVSAIVTPTIDPVTQSLVAGPIIVLYFVGVALAVLVQPRTPTA
ncbi:MAG TPA: twin-arginine translocase subunit TatC [Dehalococcoidia bacterium]|nr:twin-arginine translocase subunit TatC [Dehalococcoidia bacterium]